MLILSAARMASREANATRMQLASPGLGVDCDIEEFSARKVDTTARGARTAVAGVEEAGLLTGATWTGTAPSTATLTGGEACPAAGFRR